MSGNYQLHFRILQVLLREILLALKVDLLLIQRNTSTLVFVRVRIILFLLLFKCIFSHRLLHHSRSQTVSLFNLLRRHVIDEHVFLDVKELHVHLIQTKKR